MNETELRRYEGRNDFRIDELIGIANALVEDLAPVQPSDRVSGTFSERTIRYYMTDGVIERPIGKEGTSALYSYRHLLQVLALKVLQASYLPVKRIKEILPGRTNRELEEIVLGKGAPPLRPQARNDALAYLDALSGPPLEEAPMMPGGGQAIMNRPARPNRSEVRPPGRSGAESWERVVLEDGVELHVRSDRVGKLRSGEIRRMIERALKSFTT